MTVVLGGLGLTLLFTQGLQPLLLTALILFPLVPSQITLPPISGVYPQRVLLVVLGLAMLLDTETAKRNRWRLASLGAVWKWFAAFLVAGFLAAVVSPLPTTALSGVLFYAFHVGLPLIVGVLAARTSYFERYGEAVSVAAIAVGAIALLQYVVPGAPWSTLPLGHLDTSQSLNEGVRALSTRVGATLGHPVALGAYAAMTLPFLIRMSLATTRRTALLARCAVIALVLAIMLSQTRIAMLAVAPALLPWLVIGTRRRVIAALAVVGAVGLLGLVGTSGLARQQAILAQTISYRGERSSSDVALNNIAARSDIYVTGLRVFREHPVLGVGFRLPTQRFGAPVFEGAGRVYAFESYLMVILVEGGVLGSLLFVAFVLGLVVTASRVMAARDDRAAVYSTLLVGLVLAIGSNGFDVVVSYYWLLIGLLFGAGLTRRDSRDLPKQRHS